VFKRQETGSHGTHTREGPLGLVPMTPASPLPLYRGGWGRFSLLCCQALSLAGFGLPGPPKDSSSGLVAIPSRAQLIILCSSAFADSWELEPGQALRHGRASHQRTWCWSPRMSLCRTSCVSLRRGDVFRGCSPRKKLVWGSALQCPLQRDGLSHCIHLELLGCLTNLPVPEQGEWGQHIRSLRSSLRSHGELRGPQTRWLWVAPVADLFKTLHGGLHPGLSLSLGW